jgi:NADH-quinone oxidoreductase subunit F
MLERTAYLTKHYGRSDSHTLACYEQGGGYRGVRRALGMSRDAVVQEVKNARVRGRGGAGFDAGVKWSFMPRESSVPHYLVINADEGEPGTFKDRSILEHNPHALVEGAMIAAYAIGAHRVFVYVRKELELASLRLRGAIQEARAHGYLGQRPFGSPWGVEIEVHSGAGAYICGEETALLNSLEGRRGEPRNKPPFPAQVGAFGCPTTVNNVETIAIVPTVIELGGERFCQLSTLSSFNDGGVRLFGVSGHVNRPGLYECAVGLTLRELIYELGGGVLGGRRLLGVIPGGSSCPVHRPDEMVEVAGDDRFVPFNGKSILDLPLGVETFRAVGSMVGTCCAIVLSDAADPVLALQNLMRFYHEESCGQCTPCREGTAWLRRILDKLVLGQGSFEELNQVSEIASNMVGNTICAFADGASQPALSFVRKFRLHFEDYVLNGGNSQTHTLVVFPEAERKSQEAV